MEVSAFFILLPALHAVFAFIFYGVWRIERMPAAGWATVCFAIGTIAIPIDLLRHAPFSYGFLLAVPMHWVMLWCILNAYLSRNGDAMPADQIVRQIVIGTAAIFLATWPLDSSNIRNTMVTLVAMSIVASGLLRLRHFQATGLDRFVFAFAVFGFASYAARGIIFPVMHFGSELSRHPTFSAYWNPFYIIVALLSLFHGLVLTVLTTFDLVQRHFEANMRDALTGVGNRRALGKLANHDIGAALMVDLDHFKRVNDMHGRSAGDAVLRAIVGRMQQACIECTIVRMGGEEFAVITPPGIDPEALGETIRKDIAATPIRLRDEPIAITASIGFATRSAVERTPTAGDTWLIDRLLRWADRGLYEAKRSGRNRVVEGMGSPATPRSDTAFYSTRLVQR